MFLDQRPENLDPPDHREQVHAQHPVPARIIPGAIVTAAADAGIVDEDVHLAKARNRLVGGTLQIVLQRHVRQHAGHIRVRLAQARNRLVQRVLLDVAQHNLDARLRQRRRNAEPDSGRRAGHERRLSLE